MVKNFLLFLIFITGILTAQTNLSGTVGGMTFENTGNPFIISENLIIPAGKKIIVKEGCIFLFKPFSGLIIEGSIEVAGNNENPVVFTSINDSLFNSEATQAPDQFDWNGITVSIQARQVSFSNILLSYSVYGIKSQTPELKIENSIFANNGQFHFTINDQIQTVKEFEPYSYHTETVYSDTLVSKKIRSVKKKIAIASFICSAGSFAAMGVSLNRIGFYAKAYDKSELQEQWNNNYNKQITFRNVAIASGITGASSLTFGLILSIIDISREKRVSLGPAVSQGNINGLCATVTF